MNSLCAPGSTNVANVAHVICELVTSPRMWDDWKFKLPVINSAASNAA